MEVSLAQNGKQTPLIIINGAIGETLELPYQIQDSAANAVDITGYLFFGAMMVDAVEVPISVTITDAVNGWVMVTWSRALTLTQEVGTYTWAVNYTALRKEMLSGSVTFAKKAGYE